MKNISDQRSWEWYLKKLDADLQCDHDHIGEPEKFPCEVKSDYQPYYGNSLGGRDAYYHSFIYEETIVCSECKHETTQMSKWNPTED